LDSSLVSIENFQSEVLRLAVGSRLGTAAKNCQKPTLLMASLTKKLKPKSRKLFFHCRLKDLPSLLRVWTAF